MTRANRQPKRYWPAPKDFSSDCSSTGARASPATALINPSGSTWIRATRVSPSRPKTMNNTPLIAAAPQRRSGSGWEAGSPQMAVMGVARLMPCPPKGAVSMLKTPVAMVTAFTGAR